MFTELEARLGEVDYKNSWMIGDKLSDIEFGQHKPLQTILLKSRYWNEKDLVALSLQPTRIAEDLKDAAEQILRV
jgi:histidinol phosphatase-like enzyme